ncbi:DUF669 domain-containing protein [Enterococcus durans]|uniref:DUF669 domain-containing protein n=1 Tax=Enterococcus durans TaxID=53345 RepID=UPI00189CE2DE|nr:DUF669 domain-containing protein [Enterococcus durans]MDB1684993.1 DUF669 domain-containing protein [Enterococcus durans]
MAFMTTDYSENKQSGGYQPLPTNDYEMIIVGATEKVTPKGSEALSIDLVVRNDLRNVQGMEETNGKYHDRHVFNDNWKKTINGNYQYDTSHFQYILDAVGVPENTPINSVDELVDIITGKPVLVYVKLEDNTYNGETTKVNRVAPWGYKKTKYPQVGHTIKEKKKTTTTIEIPQDDYPF